MKIDCEVVKVKMSNMLEVTTNKVETVEDKIRFIYKTYRQANRIIRTNVVVSIRRRIGEGNYKDVYRGKCYHLYNKMVELKDKHPGWKRIFETEVKTMYSNIYEDFRAYEIVI